MQYVPDSSGMNSLCALVVLLGVRPHVQNNWVHLGADVRIAGSVAEENLIILRKHLPGTSSCDIWLARYNQMRVQLVGPLVKGAEWAQEYDDQIFALGSRVVAALQTQSRVRDIVVCDTRSSPPAVRVLGVNVAGSPQRFGRNLIGNAYLQAGYRSVLFVITEDSLVCEPAPKSLFDVRPVPGGLLWELEEPGRGYVTEQLPRYDGGRWRIGASRRLPLGPDVRVAGMAGPSSTLIVRVRKPGTSLCSIWIARLTRGHLRLLRRLIRVAEWSLDYNDRFLTLGQRIVAFLETSSGVREAVLCDFRDSGVSAEKLGGSYSTVTGTPFIYKSAVIGTTSWVLRPDVRDKGLFVVTESSSWSAVAPKGFQAVSPISGGLLWQLSHPDRSIETMELPRFQHGRWRVP